MDIYPILSTKIHNSYFLMKYIKFIERNYKKYSNNDKNIEKHHILPKANDMFPEYADFQIYEWNCILLPLKKHFYAHFLLSKAFDDYISQNYSFCLMGGRLKDKNILFLANEYEKGIKKRNKNASMRMSNKIMAYDNNKDKNILVSKEEFVKNENLVGIMKNKLKGDKNPAKREEVRNKISNKKIGFVTVFDKKLNKVTQIKREDINENHVIKTGFSGRTNFIIKTKDKVTKSITFDDPLYKTNDYVSNNSKYITLIKLNGDEIFLNNEYTRICFIKEFGENLAPTKKLSDEYKLHSSGKFMIKKVSVEIFFN